MRADGPDERGQAPPLKGRGWAGAVRQGPPSIGSARTHVPTPTPSLKRRGLGGTSLDRPALVATARDSIARGSKSFAFASRLFDRATRERAWLLYSWCRHCDDWTDGQAFGGELSAVDDPAARLAALRERTARAMAGEQTGEAPFDALAVVAAECAIPRRFVDDHLDGFALDAAGWRPATEDDLLRYCYHVAGAVGGMMAAVMGVDPADEDTLDRASDLGLAFQLANIARDVAEDAVGGRCYLPRAWLAQAGIDPADVMAAAHRPALAELTRRAAALAGAYEDSARIGAARLPRRSRWAVLAAANIYGAIGRRVAFDPGKALERRTVVGKRAKLAFVTRALREARGPAPADAGREGLWTRPR